MIALFLCPEKHSAEIYPRRWVELTALLKGQRVDRMTSCIILQSDLLEVLRYLRLTPTVISESLFRSSYM